MIVDRLRAIVVSGDQQKQNTGQDETVTPHRRLALDQLFP
jgi:hypothetical protein